MASLTVIRQALVETVNAAIPQLTPYPRISGAVNVPCVATMPMPSDFDVAMGRGTDTWNIDVIVLVQAGDEDVAQLELDGYVTGAGPASVREAVFRNRSLGLADTDAHVTGLSGYNLQYSVVVVDHVGASLRVVVHTRGTQ